MELELQDHTLHSKLYLFKIHFCCLLTMNIEIVHNRVMYLSCLQRHSRTSGVYKSTIACRLLATGAVSHYVLLLSICVSALRYVMANTVISQKQSHPQKQAHLPFGFSLESTPTCLCCDDVAQEALKEQHCARGGINKNRADTICCYCVSKPMTKEALPTGVFSRDYGMEYLAKLQLQLV